MASPSRPASCGGGKIQSLNRTATFSGRGVVACCSVILVPDPCGIGSLAALSWLLSRCAGACVVSKVIARCSTTLRWLWTLPLPPQAHVSLGKVDLAEGSDRSLSRPASSSIASVM